MTNDTLQAGYVPFLWHIDDVRTVIEDREIVLISPPYPASRHRALRRAGLVDGDALDDG